jgi:predicted DsbA family dithiol-disulfide isomerase
VHGALFKAFFEDGKDLNDVGVLTEIAATAGLDREEARRALEQGTYRERVLEDQRLAEKLGVQAVPMMLVGLAAQPLEQFVAISGAHPYETVRAAVERVLAPR